MLLDRRANRVLPQLAHLVLQVDHLVFERLGVTIDRIVALCWLHLLKIIERRVILLLESLSLS